MALSVAAMFCSFLSVRVLVVSEDSLQKNINQLRKSVKQMEIDIKNAQQDKSAPPNDRFLHVMTISFSADIWATGHCGIVSVDTF